MTDTAVKELVARLEKTTCGDNDLDRDIAIALGWTPPAMGLPHWHDEKGNHWSALPDWSTSIDDALALVDRVLGVDSDTLCYSYDLNYHCYAHEGMAYVATLHLAAGNPADMRKADAQAPTLPLAIVLATLRALHAKATP